MSYLPFINIPIMTSQSTKCVYMYKRTVDPVYWQNYMSRKLTNAEKFLLASVKQEQNLNKNIEKIYQRAKLDGLYIPELTPLDGNCLFESFRILGLCENSKIFRAGLAQLLLILKNIPNFLPGFEEPLGELFVNFNEIERVKCSKTGRIYKYDYDAMCVDLSKDTNWTRLNTELIMRIMCVLLNINIRIYNQNGHITNVNENPNENTVNICLGQIGARQKEEETSKTQSDSGFHFVPLKQAEEGKDFPKCVTYIDCLTEYHEWARTIARSLGKISISK